ncbi:polyprenyl synthetase family protein [Candidatus Aminicenantes bacterium AC-335-K20]|jgi:octaprenyl-diphosphate synthase|nr:polyprenyl synthetase family protein [SCandidatus Aminicenantes bacterium Aminicenantia_JdfR_composite]MCP2596409.1 polyprenyl synthetase family protein [Candidatus Aminicenantes bacterium AC-335-G13]MCP2606196.1 polyprenyl synthetase family protein [Candidatus Aminicenantes bacterium AC-708-I09]MCP2618213.1 polyprenyl synthetase family protein [Candidatus Aminicenantes bacterium AC-335-A11]MCP2619473.1 polyprenyl synthetase family protein [Candidatus Aminicenantes bacterium AC-335-K20]
MDKKDYSISDVYKIINSELTQLEEELKKVTQSPIDIVSKIGNYIFKGKGKRIRPALLILCSKLLGYHEKEIIRYASVIEFIHTASLIHDDIVDNSNIRRGRKTIHYKWGSNISVLLGDYLYILSIKLSLNDNSKIIQSLSDVTCQMIEGELLELNESWNFDIEEEKYLEIIKKKTASLFAGSCKIGALLANATEEEENSLTDFGLNTGIAFQIIDDMLDFTSTEKALGKPVLSDLKEGKITLPLIYTLRNRKEEILKLICGKRKIFNTEEILNIINEAGGIDYTYKKAESYINKAKKNLKIFSDSVYKDSLIILSDYVLTREK